MRLIVGVDDSDHGIQTLEEAIERARAAGDEVTVAVYSERDTDLSDLEQTVSDKLAASSFDADIVRLEGNPGSELLELAEHGEYDQILLSGGRRSPLGKIKLSSTIEFVLLNAQTTVTLVR